jgi:hypothetical protein
MAKLTVAFLKFGNMPKRKALITIKSALKIAMVLNIKRRVYNRVQRYVSFVALRCITKMIIVPQIA